jgi:hypothetical protein
MQLLYFARRDKKAVDVVAKLDSNQTTSICLPIHDIKPFLDSIPPIAVQKIMGMQGKRQMDWQLYLENFANYDDFKGKLLRRGYKGLPSSISPMIYSGKEIIKLSLGQPKKMLQKRKN